MTVLKNKIGLPEAYVLVAATIGLLWLHFALPFSATDSFSQMARVYLISQGHLFYYRSLNGVLGEYLPSGLVRVMFLYQSQMFLYNPLKITTIGQIAGSTYWQGPVSFLSVRMGSPIAPNTALLYGPILYLPQLIGLYLGEGLQFSILTTYYMMAALNGMAFVGLGYLTLKTATRGRWFFVAILLLPLSFASSFGVTQDGLLIGAGLLLAAMVIRLTSGKVENKNYWFYVGGTLAIVAIMSWGRLSYLPLFLLLGLVPLTWKGGGVIKERLIKTLVAIGVSAVVTVTFILAALRYSSEVYLPNRGQSITGQVHWQFTHWGGIGVLLNNILWQGKPVDWLVSLVGNVGWFQWIYYPWWIYLGFGMMLLLALLVGNTKQKEEVGNKTNGLWWWRIGTLVSFVLSTMLAMESMYLTWTPVGSNILVGVQGIYILPLMGFLVIWVPQKGIKGVYSLTQKWVTDYGMAALVLGWLVVSYTSIFGEMSRYFWRY